MRRTLALHMRARPRVQCCFEEYTLDAPENRALLATLHAIAANGSYLPIRRRVAHKLVSDFSGVRRVIMRSSDIEEMHCDRLMVHYEPVLRLAQVILAAMGVAHDFGGLGANGFLLNMNVLFEKFIIQRLRRILHRHGIVVRPQQISPFDQRGQAEIRPDLIIQGPHGRRIVADTKYKEKPDPETHDLYQKGVFS